MMLTADKILSIKKAHDSMQDACEAYSRAVENEFPRGTSVLVQRGSEWIGPYAVRSVSDAWWHEPGRLWLHNPRTGRYRAAAPCQVARLMEQDDDDSRVSDDRPADLSWFHCDTCEEEYRLPGSEETCPYCEVVGLEAMQ